MIEKPVVFKNNKGQQLVGMLHIPNKKGKFPAIIICHGFGGNKVAKNRMLVRIARELCKDKFIVLRFDFHGHGDSEGDFKHFRVTQEINDLKSAMKYLKKSKRVKEIGLIGHSLGGQIVILTAIKNKGIKSVIALAPVVDWSKIRFKNEINEAKRKGKVELKADILLKKTIENMTKYHLMDYTKKIDFPLLIIHGTKDDAVKLIDSKKFIKRINEPKRLIIMKGAVHNFERFKHINNVIKESKSWFKKWLK